MTDIQTFIYLIAEPESLTTKFYTAQGQTDLGSRLGKWKQPDEWGWGQVRERGRGSGRCPGDKVSRPQEPLLHLPAGASLGFVQLSSTCGGKFICPLWKTLHRCPCCTPLHNRKGSLAGSLAGTFSFCSYGEWAKDPEDITGSGIPFSAFHSLKKQMSPPTQSTWSSRKIAVASELSWSLQGGPWRLTPSVGWEGALSAPPVLMSWSFQGILSVPLGPTIQCSERPPRSSPTPQA